MLLALSSAPALAQTTSTTSTTTTSTTTTSTTTTSTSTTSTTRPPTTITTAPTTTTTTRPPTTGPSTTTSTGLAPSAPPWVQVVRLTGSGDARSPNFSLSGRAARLRYEARRQGPVLGQQLVFAPFLLRPGERLQDGGKQAVVTCSSPCADVATLARPAGTYFVEVIAGNADWALIVEEETAVAASPDNPAVTPQGGSRSAASNGGLARTGPTELILKMVAALALLAVGGWTLNRGMWSKPVSTVATYSRRWPLRR